MTRTDQPQADGPLDDRRPEPSRRRPIVSMKVRARRCPGPGAGAGQGAGVIMYARLRDAGVLKSEGSMRGVIDGQTGS